MQKLPREKRYASHAIRTRRNPPRNPRKTRPVYA